MKQVGNVLFIMLLAFVISYIVTSVFDKYGLGTTSIWNWISIITITLLIIFIIGLVFQLFLSKKNKSM